MIDYRGLSIPFTRMGRITSDDLFGPNEQVIFDFYEANRARYSRVADIGANIGVHSILMARLGWVVRAFEPDPTHFEHLVANVMSHGVTGVDATRAAVSDRAGVARFIRVLDNTTGSHLEGSKGSYGPREMFDVPVVDCRSVFAGIDFAKIDCEGNEAVLMETTTPETWCYMDALLEVGSIENARRIYHHLHPMVPMWAQKIGWGRVVEFDDMPTRHQGGSLFVGFGPPFPGLR